MNTENEAMLKKMKTVKWWTAPMVEEASGWDGSRVGSFLGLMTRYGHLTSYELEGVKNYTVADEKSPKKPLWWTDGIGNGRPVLTLDDAMGNLVASMASWKEGAEKADPDAGEDDTEHRIPDIHYATKDPLVIPCHKSVTDADVLIGGRDNVNCEACLAIMNDKSKWADFARSSDDTVSLVHLLLPRDDEVFCGWSMKLARVVTPHLLEATCGVCKIVRERTTESEGWHREEEGDDE